MKKRQIWGPDTCKCRIEQEYDLDNLDAPWTCTAVLDKCEHHQDVADVDLYGVLYTNPDGENKRKNQMLRVLLGEDEVKGLGLEEVKLDTKTGQEYTELKDGVQYEWSFEGSGANRVLIVGVKGAELVEKQKDDILALCDTKFGKGKVIIN